MPAKSTNEYSASQREASSSDFAAGVGVKPENRAGVHGAGVDQPKPVGPRAGHGLFVREDAPAERLELERRKESPARERAAAKVVFLIVAVDRRAGILPERAVLFPRGESLGRTSVAVGVLVVAFQILPEGHVHDITGIGRAKLIPLFG